MAKFVGCEAQDIFFIENATAGISTILRGLKFTSEDKILTLSLGYGMSIVNFSNRVISSTFWLLSVLLHFLFLHYTRGLGQI